LLLPNSLSSTKKSNEYLTFWTLWLHEGKYWNTFNADYCNRICNLLFSQFKSYLFWQLLNGLYYFKFLDLKCFVLSKILKKFLSLSEWLPAEVSKVFMVFKAMWSFSHAVCWYYNFSLNNYFIYFSLDLTKLYRN
jgi:hypothetical protein